MELFETLLYSQTGEGEVFDTHPLEIPGIEGERPLTLYLPPDYMSNPEREYAIAYLFDGQNLYDRAEWPMGWNLHRILDERAAAGLEVPIVVGIHHGANRDEELCPWPAEKGQTPRGDDLLDWLIHTLHPQLVDQLRIDDRPEMRMIGGSSLGGLLALYAAFRHSDFFSKIMSMSPSLWVGNGAIYDYIADAAFLHNLDSLRLYIDCGALEDDDDEETWSEGFFDEDEAEDTEAADETTDGTASAELLGTADPAASPALDSLETERKVSATGPLADADESADDSDEIEADDAALDEEEDEWETDPLEDAEYLIDILDAKGFEQGVHYEWVADPEGEHNEWHWSKRLPLAFAYLFDDDVDTDEADPDFDEDDEEDEET